MFRSLITYVLDEGGLTNKVLVSNEGADNKLV